MSESSGKTDKDLEKNVDEDPFYSEENQKILNESVSQLKNGKGTPHELIETLTAMI